jgi:hypothetical protein
MKLNYDFTLTDFDGEPINDITGMALNAGRVMANILLQNGDPATDAMVRFDWAQQLHRTGQIDLDKAGQASFKKVLETVPNLSLIIRGRLIEVLDKKENELTVK